MALNRALSVLIFGPSKVGKSTLAATAPKPMVLLDAEAGSRFLHINPVVWDPARHEPPELDGTWDTAVVSVRDFDTVLRTFAWLQSGQHPFRSVVLDSASEIQQRLIEKIAARGQASQQQWGEVFREFIGLMRDFRDLTEHPTNPLECVALVAMARQGGDGLYHPWFQGQTGVVTPYLFDVSAAMTSFLYRPESTSLSNGGGGEQYPVYRLLIGPNNQYETGERAGGRLPQWIDNPNLEDMLDLVFGDRPAVREAVAE